MTTESVSLNPLSALALKVYPELKRLHLAEGRRKLMIRVAEDFWAHSSILGRSSTMEVHEDEMAHILNDPDPYDEITSAPGIGIIVRTDHSDEKRWESFFATIRDAEVEFAQCEVGTNVDPANTENADDDMEDDDDDDTDSTGSDTQVAAPVFTFYDPIPRLPAMSNLAILRLLNDVAIRPVPPPPASSQVSSKKHRLIEQHGWQEIYTGKSIWVYDEKSNEDGCVRVVSQRSAKLFGTATGDSWRARAGHIVELAVNMYTGALTVDFGDLDRWDGYQRRRNLEEAERGLL